jgi:hypothetical protein
VWWLLSQSSDKTYLQLAIETEKQRRLSQDIKESGETSAALNLAGMEANVCQNDGSSLLFEANTWCFGQRTTHDLERVQEA